MLHLLLLGNSFIYFNDLPTLLADVAQSAGWARPSVASSTPGGFTLEQHRRAAATQSRVSEREWDAVVLQQQSELPAFATSDAVVRNATLHDVEALTRDIVRSSPRANVVLFQTWARHERLFATSAWRVGYGANASEMQERIARWYDAARDVAALVPANATVARVGDAWRANYASAAPIMLHDADLAHPAYAGSYVAALCLYATIFQTSLANVTFDGALEPGVAARLRALVSAQLSSESKVTDRTVSWTWSAPSTARPPVRSASENSAASPCCLAVAILVGACVVAALLI